MKVDTLQPVASKLRLWNKFGRFISGIVIACFFLPFFGVSCQGMDVVTVSGADMVGGCKPGGLISDMDDKKQSGDATMSGGDLEMKVDKVDREPLAIAALALALVVFGLAWVRTRKALLGACVASVLCFGTLVGLYVKVSGDLDKAIQAETGKAGGDSKLVKKDEIKSGGRMGLWATCLGLIGTAYITGRALKEDESALVEPPQPPQPPAPA